jgi:membrane protease YdiL (CAAX protease family)
MTLVASALSHLLFVYLVVGEPLVGKYCYRALQRDVATDPTARIRFFWLVIVIEWIWVATVAVVLTPRPDPLTAIGLVPMSMSPLVSGMVVGMLIGLILSTIAFAWNPRLRAGIQRQAAGVSALVPATTGERWLFSGVSLTAGVCEEIVFRGFLRLYLQDLGLSMISTGILATVIFGLAHAYQGWKGIIQTSLLGGVFMGLFIASGSLLPCMVLHALVDLRFLVLFRADGSPKPSGVAQ